MTIPVYFRGAAAAVLCTLTLAACEAGVSSPTSPTAVVGGAGAVNADGSTLKVSAPNAVFPLPDSTGIPIEAILTAQPAVARYERSTNFVHRFQVSDTDTFGTVLANGMGAVDSVGLVRFTVDPALPVSKKVFWRTRAESNDQVGPWSNVLAFTTTGPATNAPPTTPTGPTTGTRPADPAPGTRLPLPDARPAINRAQARLGTLASCPNGRKYENNPWQDAMVDDLRATDLRWGYNGKPTRTAADNNGFPVIAAGDEIAYHYGAGGEQGSREVYLIDTLESHCGASPRTTYREFTGEEPGFWTSAGRFPG